MAVFQGGPRLPRPMFRTCDHRTQSPDEHRQSREALPFCWRRRDVSAFLAYSLCNADLTADQRALSVHSEVVEVPEDSEDAKKWPRSAPAEGTSPSETSAPNHPRAASSSTSSYPASSSSIRTNSPQTSTPAGVPAKTARRPGPRRPKTTLAPLPGQQPKTKKLTVLDKSAMDWKSHVAVSGADSGLQDELAANRRGGGYLEKVDFLQRVEDRKEEAFEASKAGKRRRG